MDECKPLELGARGGKDPEWDMMFVPFALEAGDFTRPLLSST